MDAVGHQMIAAEDKAPKASWNKRLGALVCHATLVGLYSPGQYRVTEDFWAEEQSK